jgi:hypothetical protein
MTNVTSLHRTSEGAIVEPAATTAVLRYIHARNQSTIIATKTLQILLLLLTGSLAGASSCDFVSLYVPDACR